MERLLIIFLILVALNLSAVFVILQGKTPEESLVCVPTLALQLGNTPLTVTLADSGEERTLGLSGRMTLPSSEGLLFIFPEAGNWGFWMKDMHFSIDIMWLGDDFVVHTIEEDVAPETYPTIFYPTNPARYVIETSAGFSRLHGIEVGEKVTLGAED